MSSTPSTVLAVNVFNEAAISKFVVFNFCSFAWRAMIPTKSTAESWIDSFEIGIAPRYVLTAQSTSVKSGLANAGFASNSATVFKRAVAFLRIGYLPLAVVAWKILVNAFKSVTVFNSSCGLYSIDVGIVTATSVLTIPSSFAARLFKNSAGITASPSFRSTPSRCSPFERIKAFNASRCSFDLGLATLRSVGFDSPSNCSSYRASVSRNSTNSALIAALSALFAFASSNFSASNRPRNSDPIDAVSASLSAINFRNSFIFSLNICFPPIFYNVFRISSLSNSFNILWISFFCG